MRIVLGVTGSIAAYKALEVLRLLKTAGHEVKVVMTKAAEKFVGQLSFETLSGEKVNTDFWSETDTIGHIALADFADLILVAPATADFIAKLNYGITDNSLLGVCLATKAKILVAPAMNCNMYENSITQKNIADLKERGVEFIDPEEGALACGWVGSGRLADPKLIAEIVEKKFADKDLEGKNILITAGATLERIDPVRFLSNFSSGKMGYAIAGEAIARGANVEIISGQTAVAVPAGATNHKIESANDMLDKITELRKLKKYDAIIFAAAVSDYRAKKFSDTKIKKKDLNAIELELNPDIAQTVGQSKNKEILVGFSLETGQDDAIVEHAKGKLTSKKMDFIVANRAEESLGKDSNHIWIVDKKGAEEFPQQSKIHVANHILDRLKLLL